jgi:hypothetical protein
VVPQNEDARNSQTGGRHREDENPSDKEEGTGEKDDYQEFDLEKANFRKEKEEKRKARI